MTDKAVQIAGDWYVPLEEHLRITDALTEEILRMKNPYDLERRARARAIRRRR